MPRGPPVPSKFHHSGRVHECAVHIKQNGLTAEVNQSIHRFHNRRLPFSEVKRALGGCEIRIRCRERLLPFAISRGIFSRRARSYRMSLRGRRGCPLPVRYIIFCSHPVWLALHGYSLTSFPRVGTSCTFLSNRCAAFSP